MKEETKPVHRSMVLISPLGTRIIGTLERLRGRAEIIDGSVRADPTGGFKFEYEGTTHVFWDDQETVKRDGERIFLDEEGTEFAENTLLLVPEDSIDETQASPEAIVLMKDGGLIESVSGVPPGVYVQIIEFGYKNAAPRVIVVTMEGGVIHSVDGIPAGVTIRTIDLDVEDVEPERLAILDDGQPALITEYEPEGNP